MHGRKAPFEGVISKQPFLEGGSFADIQPSDEPFVANWLTIIAIDQYDSGKFHWWCRVTIYEQDCFAAVDAKLMIIERV